VVPVSSLPSRLSQLGRGASMEIIGIVVACSACFIALVHFPAYMIGTAAMIVSALAFIAGQIAVAYVAGVVAIGMGLLIRGARRAGSHRSALEQVRAVPARLRYPAVGAVVAAFLALMSAKYQGQRPDLLSALTVIVIAGAIGAAVGYMAQRWFHRNRAPTV